MAETQLWHTGVGRGWPLTDEEEHHLVSAWKRGSTHPVDLPERAHLTTVMVALREGADYQRLHAFLPGVDDSELLGAYRFAEQARARSAAAWTRLLTHPSTDTLTEVIYDIAVLLAVPARQLAEAAGLASSTRLTAVIAHLNSRIAAVTADGAAAEHRLARTTSARVRSHVTAQLSSPYADSIWSDPYFLPSRVGQLCPLRIDHISADLPDSG